MLIKILIYLLTSFIIFNLLKKKFSGDIDIDKLCWITVVLCFTLLVMITPYIILEYSIRLIMLVFEK